MTERTCRTCGTTYPATREFFTISPANPLRISYLCLICREVKLGLRERSDKRCTKCHEWKPANLDFFGHGKREGVLRAVCRQCETAITNARYHATKTLQQKPQFTPGYYRCSKCKQEKPATIEYFSADKRKDNGLSSWCKQCGKDASAKRRAERNPLLLEKAPKGSKRCSVCKLIYPATEQFFYKKKVATSGLTPGCRECAKKQRRLNRLFRLEEEREKSRLLYRKSPGRREHALSYAQKYRERLRSDPEMVLKIRIETAQRTRRRRGVPGRHTHRQVLELLEVQGHRCFYCSVELAGRGTKGNEWQVEHFIPVTRGGTHHIENIRIACATCNAAKNRLMPWEWLPDRFPPPDQQAAD